MGGTVDGGRWNAPEGSVSLEGGVRIMTGTGQTIEIQKMVLDGAVRGKLGGDSPLGIECEMEMMPRRAADRHSPCFLQNRSSRPLPRSSASVLKEEAGPWMWPLPGSFLPGLCPPVSPSRSPAAVSP